MDTLGFGRCLVYKNTKATAKKYVNQTFNKLMGPLLEGTGKPPYKHAALVKGIVYTGSKMQRLPRSTNANTREQEAELFLATTKPKLA